MSCKHSIFINCCSVVFGFLLLMNPKAIEIITAKYKVFMHFEERTQSNVSLAEFSARMLKLYNMLPTRKTDDIRLINDLDDPFFKDFLDEIMADYKDIIQIVPEAAEDDTYDFITKMRIFSIQLDKAKKSVENATKESPEYQKFQEHHKAGLIKLMARFNKHVIDVAERYWNSLSAEKRTDAQKEFYEKIQEITIETDVEKGYDDLYILLKATAPHVKK